VASTGGQRLAPGQAARTNRWRSRPVLAGLLRIVIILIPVLCAAAVTIAFNRLLTPSGSTHWMFVVAGFASALGVALVTERLARRLLPVAMLLKLTLLFPDRAPSRFKVARQSNAVRKLQDAQAAGGKAADTASSVLALLASLTAHDRKTRGHAERVRVYADLLADQLRLSQQERDLLRWGSLLHDIGKLEVAAEILNKPGRPTAREWSILRGHPARGAELASALLPWLREWGKAIVEHHERYDGTGYPRGLAGDAISRAGRLVAVVDAYEVMTSARSYKKAMTTARAREELARCAGSHFDPAMVRAFMAISLPKLLWATGPLSFLVQLPFVGLLRDAGSQAAATAGTQAVSVAGAALLAAAGTAVAGVAPAAASSPPSKGPVAVGTGATPVAAGPGMRARAAAEAAPSAGRLSIPSATSHRTASAVSAVIPLTAAAARTVTSFPTSGPTDSAAPTSPTTAASPATPPAATPPATKPPEPSGTRESPPEQPGTVRVSLAPPPTTGSSAALVVFDAPGSDRSECMIDGGVWHECVSPLVLQNLSDGSHTLRLRGRLADVLGPATAVHWRVDTTAPGLTITGGPTGRVATSTAAISYAADSDAAVSCTLDGVTSPCGPSRWTATGLTEGIHTVVLTATDAWGNATSTSRSWTVDATAPSVIVLSGPLASSTATAATVGFAVDDPTATTSCTLNGTATSCSTTSWSATGLAPGHYTLVVTATDAAGNVGTGSHSWTVLPVPATVRITSGPPDGSHLFGSSGTFAFTSPDPAATFECSRNAATYTPCTSPFTFSTQGTGIQTFAVRAVNAGGTGPAITRTWSRDAAAKPVVVSGPSSITLSSTATFTVSPGDADHTLQCSLDGATATPCSTVVQFTGLSAGTHTLRVQDVDSVGDAGPPTMFSWIVL
jgi:putative nucleotidyltransferase with HDIG domain